MASPRTRASPRRRPLFFRAREPASLATRRASDCSRIRVEFFPFHRVFTTGASSLAAAHAPGSLPRARTCFAGRSRRWRASRPARRPRARSASPPSARRRSRPRPPGPTGRHPSPIGFRTPGSPLLPRFEVRRRASASDASSRGPRTARDGLVGDHLERTETPTRAATGRARRDAASSAPPRAFFAAPSDLALWARRARTHPAPVAADRPPPPTSPPSRRLRHGRRHHEREQRRHHRRAEDAHRRHHVRLDRVPPPPSDPRTPPVAQNISPRARHWCTLPAFPRVAFPSPVAIVQSHPRVVSKTEPSNVSPPFFETTLAGTTRGTTRSTPPATPRSARSRTSSSPAGGSFTRRRFASRC